MSTLPQRAGGIAPVRVCGNTSDNALPVTVTVGSDAGKVATLDNERYPALSKYNAG